MNINEKDVKRIKRIFRKYNVSFEFVLLNFSKITQLYKYVINPHFVIKRKLVKKRNKIVIKYNTLRKSLFASEKKKKNRNNLPWSTRVVRYLKRQRNLEKNQIDNENVPDDGQSDSLSPEEIQKKLKEQLELLKSGKKTVPLIGGSEKDEEPVKIAKISVRDLSSLKDPNLLSETERENNEVEYSDELENIINSQHIEGSSGRLLVLPDYGEESNDTPNEICSADEDPLGVPCTKNMKFLDLLINKMQNAVKETDDVDYSEKDENLLIVNQSELQEKDTIDEIDYSTNLNEVESMDCSNYENLNNPLQIEIPPVTVKDNENPVAATTASEETSSSSSEFLGFTEYELVPSTVPGMLPTPVVAKSKRDLHQSAFVSEDLENFLRENSLESTVPVVQAPKRSKRHEDGLMRDGATPPKMVMPVVPEELTKPRTVAEKRNVLQKKQSIKYYMIENENTIYRELKKRTKHGKANTNIVRCIQNLDVPCTRDCWKASAWLVTENGRFYFQMLKVDDVIVKLIGGSGNYISKYMSPQVSKPSKKCLPKVCSPGCRQNVDFRNIVINMSDDECDKEDKQLASSDLKFQIGLVDEKPTLRPGPLSSKCISAPFQPNMGELEVYEMPKVRLEVFPEIDKPLDDAVKPYLKYILPSNCITREWAEFAVSTVVTKTEVIDKEHPKSFTFTIPYLNNQNNILVRKMYNRKEKLERFSTEDFEFRKKVEPDDEIANECADILSEMINSVAIGLSEDSLVKDDPDIDYSNNTKVNEETVRRDSREEKVSETSEKKPTRTKKNKLVSELRKLNATVIDAESLCSVETKLCKMAHCRYGCICQSLAGQPIQRKYCKRSECMLQNSCKHIASTDMSDLMNSSLTTESALMIRRKATEKLAKVEKDFCATVVLTDKETYVINEPIKERKRPKRTPKRFIDYDTTEGKERHVDDDNNDESLSSIPKLYPFDDEPPPKKFKHCTVDLVRLQGLELIEPWCMVHCLYKCFCKGESVTGVPFEIKKEETIVTEEIAYPRRKIYSFDKETPVSKINLSNPQQSLLKRRNTSVGEQFEPSTKLQKIDTDNRMESICRRIMPVPTIMYLKENRRRAPQIRRTIKICENGSTRLQLVDKMRKSCSNPANSPVNRSLLKRSQSNRTVSDSSENTIEVDVTPNTAAKTNESSKFPIISSVCSLSEVPELNLKLNSQSSCNLSETLSNSSLPSTSNSSQNAIGASNFMNPLKPPGRGVSSQVHNQLINQLNAAVTQSMHSICTIQLNNTKKIPDPVPNTLSCHQWNLFLQAYVESTLHIWEIRVDNGSFLAATITNMMPIVHNALSVINIKAIPKQKLPLVGKMLNAKFINDKTKTLSVLLTGHRNYWRIIGFIHSSYDYLTKGGYFKPTPQSHPSLSKKINLLYNMMFLKQVQKGNIVPMKSTTTTAQKTALHTTVAGNIQNVFLTGPSIANIPNTNTTITPSLPPPLALSINRSILPKSALVSEASSSNLLQKINQSHVLKNFILPEPYASTSKTTIPLSSSFAIASNYNQSSSEENSADNSFTIDQNTVGIPTTQVPKCNLDIKRVSYKDIEGIVIPIAIPGDHRWLVLDIVGDFSHIYIPAWKNFLSYDKIKKAITLTQRTKKIVRIGQDKSKIDVFATPDIRERIYLGPYDIDSEQDVVLYQNIDGRMMLREDFEISHNIIRERRTTGFWLYKKFGKLIFDIDLRSLQINTIPPLETTIDDDCMIVDEKVDFSTDSNNTTIYEKHENTETKPTKEEKKTDRKAIVPQQSTTTEDPLEIDLDSDTSLHESNIEIEKNSENSSDSSHELLKPLTISTMQVAKISTKSGFGNLKIIKTAEGLSISKNNTSIDKLEEETSKPSTPVNNAQIDDEMKSEEKDQTKKSILIPKDLKIGGVSISPVSNFSSNTKCYGPKESSEDSNEQTETPKSKESTSVAETKSHGSTTPTLTQNNDSKDITEKRRSSLSAPMSLLIKSLKPQNVTTKTSSSPILSDDSPKSTKKVVKVGKLISSVNTSTTSTAPTNSQRLSNFFNTTTTKTASSKTKSGTSSPSIFHISKSTNSSSEKSNIEKTKTTEIHLNGLKLLETTSITEKTKMLEIEPIVGWVECEDANLDKIPAKKVGEVYFLKLPTLKGVCRVRGMEMVNKYINCYFKKHANLSTNMDWKFIPHKIFKRLKMPTYKIKEKVSKDETSTTKGEPSTSSPRKFVLTLAKNSNILKRTAVSSDKSLQETESKLTKLKDFTVKKTVVPKNPIREIIAKEKWRKAFGVNETATATATSTNPNSLLRKVLSQPSKLPPVPPPEKTTILLTTPAKAETPPPNVKTPPPVTSTAVKTSQAKSSLLLPISLKSGSEKEEVILIDDDE